MGRASPVTRIPSRHWRTYGHNYLTGTEALDEPFAAFPPWFLRVTCERCGQERMFNEAHAAQHRVMPLRDIIARMRHDGCGGQGWTRGACERHRGRQQPAGATHRAAGGLTPPAGWSVRELSIPHRHGRSVFKPRSKARDCVLPEVLFAAAMP
jgi:hypothetical protein